jgi:hypothetical protein
MPIRIDYPGHRQHSISQTHPILVFDLPKAQSSDMTGDYATWFRGYSVHFGLDEAEGEVFSPDVQYGSCIDADGRRWKDRDGRSATRRLMDLGRGRNGA